MTEYYARVSYTYQGGDRNFSIPFSYIDKEHIKVLVNNQEINNYNYLNNSQIQIDETLTSGDLITIIRTTPINERMVVYSDTSILNKDNQNLAQEQMFDSVQEIHDNLENHKEDVETLKPYIKTAAENIEHIIAVNENEANINIVADSTTDINTVSDNITNINTVADNTNNIDAVADNITNINAVNANKTNIDTVAGNNTNINAVADNQTNINSVANSITDVNTVADNLSNINAVKSNENNINSVVSNSVNINAVSSNISNITTVRNNINKIGTVADNINIIDSLALEVDRIDQSKGKKSGSISNNQDILNDIKQYSHSTFDSSKFTFVGTNYTLTDGICSIADSTLLNFYNIESTITFSQLNNHSWKVRTKWINKGITRRPTDTTKSIDEAIIKVTHVGAYGIVEVKNNSLGFTARFGDGNQDSGGQQISAISKSWSSLGYQTDNLPAYLIAELGFDITTGVYTLRAKFEENDWVTVGTYTPLTANKQLYSFYTHPNDKVGWSVSGKENCVYNALDLKYAYIEIDGIPVFSGNNTGIDTIKPDNYNVVGTPTISADGIASGFSGGSGAAGNYLTEPISIPADKDFEVKLQYPVTQALLDKRATNNNQELLGCVANSVYTYAPINVTFYSSGGLGVILRLNLESGGTRYLSINSRTYNVGDIVTIIFGRNKAQGKYYARFYQNGTLIETQKEILDDIDLSYSAPLVIGRMKTDYAGQSFWGGSIDLNSFKIYANGNLAYQPCLKIPYTESKTGSKIVDSIYRDRVSDMYEQFGYAPYYTLSDTDFTLPMGELYGMMRKNTDGQWIYKYADIATDVAWGTDTPEATYSLSSYLPDDGYDYEVLFIGTVRTSTTSGDFATLLLKTDIITPSGIPIAYARTRTASEMGGQGNGILPVGQGRFVKQYSTSSANANGTYTLQARAYRRIGKNS